MSIQFKSPLLILFKKLTKDINLVHEVKTDYPLILVMATYIYSCYNVESKSKTYCVNQGCFTPMCSVWQLLWTYKCFGVYFVCLIKWIIIYQTKLGRLIL